MLQKFVRVLDHDDGRIHHRADGDGNAAERHDVGGQSHPIHRQERKENGDGQRDDGNERGAECATENQTYQRDDNAFFNQLLSKCRNRSIDKLAAVVGGHEFNAFGQGRF